MVGGAWALGATMIAAVGLALVAPAAVARAEAPVSAAAPATKSATPGAAATTVAWDPAIRRGVLPNGLRYALMRNATPKGALSVRLAMEIGSFEETDPERGAAHFVEHLAFAGSKDMPADVVERAFATAGVAWG